jgi:hypothetical protein
MSIKEPERERMSKCKSLTLNYLDTYIAGVPLTVIAFLNLVYIPLMYGQLFVSPTGLITPSSFII